MDTVTLSPQFQFDFEVPPNVREELGLKPGDKFQVTSRSGALQLIPIRPIQEMRGILRGMNTDIEREEDRL